MCPTDYLGEGGIMLRGTRHHSWGDQPWRSNLLMHLKAMERQLLERYPNLAFSISLEWVDLDMTWGCQPKPLAAHGPELQSTSP